MTSLHRTATIRAIQVVVSVVGSARRLTQRSVAALSQRALTTVYRIAGHHLTRPTAGARGMVRRYLAGNLSPTQQTRRFVRVAELLQFDRQS
jgi:hypothetical protein